MTKEYDEKDVVHDLFGHLTTEEFFCGLSAVAKSLETAYKAALRLSEGKVRWFELPEDVRADIQQYEQWATRNISWQHREKARKRDIQTRKRESVFFTPVPKSALDLEKAAPEKFLGPVLWIEDQEPSRPNMRMNDREFKITTSGLQVMGDQSAVMAHVEAPGVTEILFPLWALDVTNTNPFESLTQYVVEDNSIPIFLHGQLAMNRLVGSTYALRIKSGTSLQLDVYEPGYEEPSHAIKPIILPPGKKHSAESNTQFLYFALKLRPEVRK